MPKTYFITGANRGIGLALVKRLSADRNNIIIGTVRTHSSATTLRVLAHRQGNIHILRLDISDPVSVNKLAQKLDLVAPDGIDYYIANAGVATSEAYAPVLRVGESVWMEHYKTNALGPILVSQALYPHMLKKDTRVMCFVTSVVGIMGERFIPVSVSAYGQSKCALNHSVRLLAEELKDEEFVVVGIDPGVVESGITEVAQQCITDTAMREAFKKTTISADESAEQQARVIEGLTLADNGCLIKASDGRQCQW